MRALRRTIEAAASGALDDDPAWASQPDADFAKILLFDQLARNCFRGTDRAFAYDPLALDLSLRMCSDLHLLDTAPVGMLHFLSSPLIHSEDVDDHDVALEVCSNWSGGRRVGEIAGPTSSRTGT